MADNESKPFKLPPKENKYEKYKNQYWMIVKGNDTYLGKIIDMDFNYIELCPYKGIKEEEEVIKNKLINDGKIRIEYRLGELTFTSTTRKTIEVICQEQNDELELKRLEIEIRKLEKEQKIEELKKNLKE